MVILYGAGQEFVKIIEYKKINRFDYVVDTYPEKYRGGGLGYTIHDKSKLSDLTEKDFVCITSTKWYDEIVQIIKEINNIVTIINLYQLDWMDNILPKLLEELKDREDVYKTVEDERLRQWLRASDEDEIEYWKRRIPEVRDKGDRRFTQREFVYPYNPEIRIKEDDMVLDVGAGPLPKFGNRINGHNMKYIPLDPLAYSYKKMLDDLDIKLPVYTKFALMEILTCFYPAESADYVIVNNALDHSIDILRAFIECIEVVRVEGYLLLEHVEAEGAYNEYAGLHAWNITLIGDDLIFFDKTRKVNVSKMFSTFCEIDSKRIKQGDRDLIISKIRKKRSISEDIRCKFSVKEFAGKIISVNEYMRTETVIL